MSRRVLAPLLLLLTAVGSIAAQDHKATLARPTKDVFQDARDGLSQMGYTLDKVDSTTFALVGSRALDMDPVTGTTIGEIDIQLSAGTADSTVIEVHATTWRQLIQQHARHKAEKPSAQLDVDATRLLAALR